MVSWQQITGAVLLAGSASISLAGDWSLGAGVLFEQLPYRDYDNQVYPLPVIQYEGERVYLSGIGAGVYLLNTDSDKLYLNVYLSPVNFDPADSDDPAMKKLNKRRATAMAGIGYKHMADWGTIRTELAADVLGKSDGIIADVAYQYPLQFNKWRVEPGVGVQWQSSDHNDYYYGISHNESRRSGLDYYSAGDGFSPYAELSVHYAFNKNWRTFFTGRYTSLSSAVKDSPMTEHSSSVIFGTGVVYTFD